MSVAAIMSKRVVSVHMDDSLGLVRELFEETGFHHLLVVDNENHLLGIISDRDLLKALSPFLDSINERMRDRSTLLRKAHQIMTRDPITLSPTSSMVKAINLFNRHTLSCLPVVDKNNHPVGMVSWRDILQHVEAMVDRKREE